MYTQKVFEIHYYIREGSNIMRFFGIVGLFALVVFIILLIVSFFKKSPKQLWVIGILSGFLCISISIIISMNSELTQKTDIVNRFGESSLTNLEIRGLSYEVILREVMGEELSEVMDSLEDEFNLSKKDVWDINSKAMEIMNDASEDITTNIDSTLLDCAKNTFAKIGIKEELSFEVIRDDESSGIRDVSLLTEYESIKMKFSCMSVDEWYPVSIQDADSDNYYWLDDDVKDYGDVYNWKTGEIISKQASPLPDPVENFKEGSEEIMEELDKELEELRESFKNLEIRK